VPPAAADQLAGGRIDVIQSATVPTLVYKRRQHTISVGAATGVLAGRLATNVQSINGTNVVVWRSADMTYWAASDLNAAELTAFAKLFAAAP
jgi:anti-sigma factor RsiW